MVVGMRQRSACREEFAPSYSKTPLPIQAISHFYLNFPFLSKILRSSYGAEFESDFVLVRRAGGMCEDLADLAKKSRARC